MIRHICPAAEEDQGAGLVGQGPQVHFNVGCLLGMEGGCWLGSLLSPALNLLPGPPLSFGSP